jgi:hypothetical protein
MGQVSRLYSSDTDQARLILTCLGKHFGDWAPAFFNAFFPSVRLGML